MNLKLSLAMPRVRFPGAYRQLLASPQMRLLLAGLGVSSLGDGISTVTIAWLAVRTAPAGPLGLFVGLAIAACTLPGILGALTLGGILRGRPARALVLAHCLLRATTAAPPAAAARTSGPTSLTRASWTSCAAT